MRFSYHESNHLRALELKTVGAPWTSILVDSDYNARGQRTRLDYGSGSGSGIRSHFTWDEKTFRVRRIHSVRTSDAKVLQDLQYVYDAAGNIVEQADEAQQDLYFSNTVVSPLGRYRYDALYRLVEAEGREHPGQQPGSADLPWSQIPHANTTDALLRYTEQYTHDAVGNILQMKHAAGSSSWTRNYRYDTASSRLLATSLPGDPQGGPYSATYTYDAAGNMTSMPHLSSMRWDWAQRLKASSRGGGGDVFYTYDASGQRVRKHYRHAYTDDRVYLGPWEIERRHSGSTLQTERLTIHLFDGDRRLAIVEILTHADGKPVFSPPPRYRYQLPNHLESSCIETDELGRLITYEEYHPFGTTSFRAIGGTPIGLSLKRYRYTGMERDEETSLAYHSARYYVPWLGRWTSPDPLGMVDGTNLFLYSSNSPLGNLARDRWEPLESTLDAAVPYNYASFDGFLVGFPMSMLPENFIRTWESGMSVPRFATVDVGTNTVLLLVAERDDTGVFHPVLERMEITRLGRGVDKSRRLDPAAIADTVAAVESFVDSARAAGAAEIAITASSAARDAANGDGFFAAVQKATGVVVEVISGETEASLVWESARRDFWDPSLHALAVVDIGGGSTELTYGDGGGAGADSAGGATVGFADDTGDSLAGRAADDSDDRGGGRAADDAAGHAAAGGQLGSSGQPTWSHSFDVGAVRLTERHLRSDPPGPAELDSLRADLRSELAGAPRPSPGARLVGIAGTVTTLCAIELGITSWDGALVHGKRLTATQVRGLADRLARMDLASRKAVPGLPEKRADVIVAGAEILAGLMETLGFDSVTVSDRGVRWGLLYRRFGD